MPSTNVRIVLVRPQGGANVGAAARAMKNMGFSDLALVQPAERHSFWSSAMAVHADDVLERARLCASLPEAVADCTVVVGTSARDGGYRAEAETPRTAAPSLVAAAQAGRVALVFGPEDHGLSNEDLEACHRLLRIPTAADYSSLNLAQAVLVCCYELHLAAATHAPTPTRKPASAERVGFVFDRLEQALLTIGFLWPENPGHLMHSIRRTLSAGGLDERDANIWLGVARQIEWFAAARRCAGDWVAEEE